MDKETLSNYGWIVICVLVLAVMIALATPFGSYISSAVKSTTQGLFDVNQSALNSTGLINIGDQSFTNGGNGGEGGSGGYEVVDGNNNNLHYHNDILFTGTCGSYTYEDGKIISKITFDFNGGVGISNSGRQICTSLDYTNATSPSIAYTNTDPTRDGYILLGWSESNTATIATYATVYDIPRVLGENVTYYAVWKASVAAPTLISFTIDGTNYQAEEGMSWDRWTHSDYNTSGFKISAMNIINSSETMMIHYQGTEIKPNDTIMNYRYELQPCAPTTPTICTFTIDGTSYQFIEGMTWEDWVDSDYNTEFVIHGNTIYNNRHNGYVYGVVCSDIIQANSYSLVGSGAN